MVWRAPRPRTARAPGVALVIAAAVLAGTIAQPVRAQPAATDAELTRARDLYAAAEAAVAAGRFDDAARDYAAAYELSKDPALFFKLGRAHERAGRCDVALTYYARYLREGSPAAQFVATTRERIATCGGSPDLGAPGQTGSGSAASGSAATAGSASSAVNDRSEAGGTAAGQIIASATPHDAGSATATPGLGVPTAGHKIAWVLTGGAVAAAALGGILAYATNSAENDIRDLYAGFAGQPTIFDARTEATYEDLVAQGRRYQRLSWTAFGVAGAAAIGAGLLFAFTGRAASEPPRIAPVVTPQGAGVTWSF